MQYDPLDFTNGMTDSRKRDFVKRVKEAKGTLLWNAKRNQCRFIAEGWDDVLLATCCGNKVTGTRSYCDEHAKIVYRFQQPTNRG